MELKQALEGSDVGRDPREVGGAEGGVAQARRGGLRPGDGGAGLGSDRQRRAALDDDEVVEEGDYEVIDEEAKTS